MHMFRSHWKNYEFKLVNKFGNLNNVKLVDKFGK